MRDENPVFSAPFPISRNPKNGATLSLIRKARPASLYWESAIRR